MPRLKNAPTPRRNHVPTPTRARTTRLPKRVPRPKKTAAVAEVATSKGIDLVIAEQRPEFPDNLDQFNVEQVRAIINQRNILFSTATADLSNDVINAMDAKYKAGK